jgi:CRP-like cAMP-binding protein
MGEDGKESIIRILQGGDTIGHRSLFSSQHLHATATALENTDICFINKKFVMETVESNPRVAYKIIESVSRQLGASEKRIAELTQKNVRERVAGFLLLLSETHGVKSSAGTLINLKLTREELASIVGTATETVIRVISDFKKELFISQQSRFITILDTDGLIKATNTNS